MCGVSVCQLCFMHLLNRRVPLFDLWINVMEDHFKKNIHFSNFSRINSTSDFLKQEQDKKKNYLMYLEKKFLDGFSYIFQTL